MATPFKDASDAVQNAIDKYNSAREILFQCLQIYNNDPDVTRYDSVIMGLDFFATIEYAQNVNQIYEKFVHGGTLTTQQIKSLDNIFDKFQKQCEADQIYYTLPPTRLILDNNQTALPVDLTLLTNQLHLYAAYLNGISKINSAMGGEYLQMIFASSGYGGTATPGGRLFIDIQMLPNPQDMFHVMLHEYEHYVDFRRTGDSTDKSHLSKLPLIIPSFLRNAPSVSRRKEVFADLGAALTAAIYKIPLSYAYSRFAATPALSPSEQRDASHPSGDERALMMQTVISVLRKHFNENKFGKEDNQWKKFADNIQDRAQLRFKEFPTLADLNAIYNASPNDIPKQMTELKRQFPALFNTTVRGDTPPPVLVDSRIRQAVAGQKFPLQNLDNLPLTTIAELQKGGPLIAPRPTPFPPAIQPNFSPFPPINPLPPAIRPSFAPFPPINPLPPAIRPSFAPFPPFPPAIRPTFSPFLPRFQQPRLQNRGYTSGNSSAAIAPLNMTNTTLEAASANLMLASVLVEMTNKTLNWAFPRWRQPRKNVNISIIPDKSETLAPTHKGKASKKPTRAPTP